jgi:hypothetical protein
LLEGIETWSLESNENGAEGRRGERNNRKKEGGVDSLTVEWKSG